jgi:hypothetical protein
MTITYVLIVEHDDHPILLSVHPDLDEAEDALRAHAASIYVRPSDDDIVELLLDEQGQHVRLYECGYDKRRKAQTFVYVKPFACSVAA